MSGKTTFLTQQASLVLLGQVGSFVPAEYAAMPCVEAIYCCTPRESGDELDRSSFYGEMHDVANILQNATPDSLVLLDEIGRSTSARDATTIVFAVCEALLELGCQTFFATHAAGVTELFQARPGVAHVHLVSRVEDGRLELDHRVEQGDEDRKHYGLALASAVGEVSRLCGRAYEIAAELEADRRRPSRPSQPRGATDALQDSLERLLESDLDEGSLLSALDQLQRGNLMRSSV